MVRAQALKWDGVREQLTAGGNDTLELVRGSSSGRDDRQDGESTSRIELVGTGLSASAVSRSFQFSGEVSGTIYTRRKKDAPQ